jgi:hypothetical protein
MVDLRYPRDGRSYGCRDTRYSGSSERRVSMDLDLASSKVAGRPEDLRTGTIPDDDLEAV